MKKNKSLLILLLALVVLLVGGTVGYNALKDRAALPESTMTPPPTAEEQPDLTESAREPAKAAPDFTVYDSDGNAVTLSSKKGKPVLVNFWATWCGPCKAEMPDLNEAFAAYGDKIEFMMVNLTDGYSDTVESATAFVQENGYTFPVYFDTDMSGSTAYGVSSIPTTILVGADGTLLHTQIGTMREKTIAAAIETLLSSGG